MCLLVASDLQETDMDDNYTVTGLIVDTLALIAGVSILGSMAIIGPYFFGG